MQRDSSPDSTVDDRPTKSILQRVQGSTLRRQSMSQQSRRTTNMEKLNGRQTRIGGAAGRGSIMIGNGAVGALFNKERRNEGHTFITTCQAWKMPKRQLMANSVRYPARNAKRNIYFNDYTEYEYYCPACDLFFADRGQYLIHIAHKEMVKPVDKAIEKASQQIQQFDQELEFEEMCKRKSIAADQGGRSSRLSNVRFRHTQIQRKRETKIENKARNTFTLDKQRKWYDLQANLDSINLRRDKLTKLSLVSMEQESRTKRRKSMHFSMHLRELPELRKASPTKKLSISTVNTITSVF